MQARWAGVVAGAALAAYAVAVGGALSATASPCPPQPGAVPGWFDDVADPGPGGTRGDLVYETPYWGLSTKEAVASMDALAVLRVVSHRAPVAVAGHDLRERQFRALPSGLPYVPAKPADRDAAVVRPARFALVRTLKGTAQPCLDLDVPGGTAGARSFGNPYYSEQLEAGTLVLATLAAGFWPGSATAMYAADRDGWLHLPFGGNERVNLRTWSP